MEKTQNYNLFKESLLTTNNTNVLESINIQTIEVNNNQNTKCNNVDNIDISEIQLKYNNLKKKINLLWKKIE